MSQQFDKIKVAGSSRSTFDLSHHQVTSSDFGYIIPICYRDMLPNDDFTVTPKVFCRLAPLASPAYGRIVCRMHSFFVPYRILYPHWDAFITQDESNHTIPPYLTYSYLSQILAEETEGRNPRGFYTKVMSNLGLNPNLFTSEAAHSLNDERFAAFPFLAYYRIWLDYFMDSSINSHSTLSESFRQYTQNGGALNDIFIRDIIQVRNACYKKDYFTTMRQNAQAGSPAGVNVPIADVDTNPGLPTPSAGSSSNLALSNYNNTRRVKAGSASAVNDIIGRFKIEAVRMAEALQRYSERSNYVGSKLINQLLVHFGVAPTAERLDMAEFLGGSSFNVEIRDVTSQSGNSTSTSNIDTFGLGTQAGKGVGAGQGDTVHYHAKEHGIFMTVMSILPDTGYYQGFSRFWTKGVTGDALDYITPEFANLGYQEVLNKELFVPFDPEVSYQSWNPDGILGYQPRGSEYKFAYDILGSDFVASDAEGSNLGCPLDSFHLFRKLSYDDGHPLALNNNLVECSNINSDYDRIFQVTNNTFDHFYFNIDVDVKAVRDLPSFAEPSIDAVQHLGDGNSIELPYGGTRL